MRILLISDYLPYPLIGGDRIRIYNLLQRVAVHHDVSLVAFLEKPEDSEGITHLQQFCASVDAIALPPRSRLQRLSGMFRYALEGKPPELNSVHSNELARKINKLASAVDFDIVQIEHGRMDLYLEALPLNKRPKSVLMFHNFSYQQYGRVSRIERRWDRKLRSFLNSTTMLGWEPRYAQRFDRSTTVSELDKKLLLDANPHLQVDVIPNGVDIKKYQPLPEQSSPTLIFIGNMTYAPSADAVIFFCQKILPHINRMVGTVEFWIVGRDPPPEVLQLNGNGVHVTGQVEDVIPYYRKSSVCVVPLRAGGGTRLKILESMALGRPVISTSIGCEGLDVVDGQHLLVADDAEQFAEKTVRLLTDQQLHQTISANGRQLVETRYDWDVIAKQLMKVYSDVLAQPTFREAAGKDAA